MLTIIKSTDNLIISTRYLENIPEVGLQVCRSSVVNNYQSYKIRHVTSRYGISSPDELLHFHI